MKKSLAHALNSLSLVVGHTFVAIMEIDQNKPYGNCKEMFL